MALAASTLTLFGDIASHLVCLKIGMYHYFEDQILGKNEDKRHWLLDLPSISPRMKQTWLFPHGFLSEIHQGNCGYTSTDAGFASGLFMIGAVTNGIQWQRKVMKLTVFFHLGTS